MSAACWLETTTVSSRTALVAVVLDGDLGLAVRAQVGHGRRPCGPRTAAGRAGARARSAAASARGSRRRRSRTSGPGRRRPGGRAGRRRPRPGASYGVVDALGDVGDCAPIETDTPQERAVEALRRGVVADVEDPSRGRSSGCRRTPSVVTSPATCTWPVVISVSTATRLRGSSVSRASRIESLIWSAILSGWPSVTDSEVNRRRDTGAPSGGAASVRSRRV